MRVRQFTMIWLLCLGMTTLSWSQSQVRFVSELDARQVVLSSYFSITFTLHNGKGTSFKPPSFKNFNVLGGPNTSTSVSIINGRRSQSIGYTYQLQPKRIGRFSIDHATIKVNGATLRTNQVEIEVVKGRDSKATTQKELSSEIGKNIFLRAVPSTTKAKVGEQVLLDYKLYYNRDIEKYNLIREAEYEGFYAQDIRNILNSNLREVVDGVQYNTKILKRVALFPQQTGLLVVDTMELQLFVIAEGESRRGRSFFYTPKTIPLQVTTDATPIEVTPLPQPAPPSFSGAVGKFQMRSTFNRDEMSTDNALSLRMFITGTGDIKQIQAPELNLPAEFEVYDPKVLEDASFENRGQINGKKIFEYLLLPKKPGRYNLSADFTYFDTDSLRYITLSSDTLNISVSQGTQKEASIARRPEVVEEVQDIRFIQTNTTLRKKGTYLWGTGLLWVLCLLPLIVLGGVWYQQRLQLQRDGMDIGLVKSRKAQKLAQKRLALSQQYLDSGKSKAFYDEVSRASFGYICDKIGIPLSELTKQNVQQKLHSLKVSENHIEQFMSIVKTCEMALFAGKDNAAAMKETYQNTMDVIVKIEEEIG